MNILYHGTKKENIMSILMHALIAKPLKINFLSKIFKEKGIFLSNDIRLVISYISYRENIKYSDVAVFEVDINLLDNQLLSIDKKLDKKLNDNSRSFICKKDIRLIL